MPLRGSSDWPVLAPDAPLLSAPRISWKPLFRFIGQFHDSAHYDGDDLRKIVDTYVSICVQVGLDPLLVMSQLVVESHCLKSASSKPPRLDPLHISRRRLGTSRGTRRQAWFSSWAEVARIHAGLLLAYALPAGDEKAVQRTLIKEATKWRRVPRKLRGSAPRLDLLEAAWAPEISAKADVGDDPPPAVVGVGLRLVGDTYADMVREIADMITQPQW
jgi:hypothetical protein